MDEKNDETDIKRLAQLIKNKIHSHKVELNMGEDGDTITLKISENGQAISLLNGYLKSLPTAGMFEPTKMAIKTILGGPDSVQKLVDPTSDIDKMQHLIKKINEAVPQSHGEGSGNGGGRRSRRAKRGKKSNKAKKSKRGKKSKCVCKSKKSKQSKSKRRRRR